VHVGPLQYPHCYNDFLYPPNPEEGLSGWFPYMPECTPPSKIWISTASANGPKHVVTWGTPTPLTGTDGEHGNDGDTWYNRTWYSDAASRPHEPRGTLNKPNENQQVGDPEWKDDITAADNIIWGCTGHAPDPDELNNTKWDKVFRAQADSIFTVFWWADNDPPTKKPQGNFIDRPLGPTKHTWCRTSPSTLGQYEILWTSHGYGNSIRDIHTVWSEPISSFSGLTYFMCSNTKPGKPTSSDIFNPNSNVSGKEWEFNHADCGEVIWQVTGSNNPLKPTWSDVTRAIPDSIYSIYKCAEGYVKPLSQAHAFNDFLDDNGNDNGIGGWYTKPPECTHPSKLWVATVNANGPDQIVRWGVPTQMTGADPKVITVATLRVFLSQPADFRPPAPEGGTYTPSNGNWVAPASMIGGTKYYWKKLPYQPNSGEILWESFYSVVIPEEAIDSDVPVELLLWGTPAKSAEWLNWDDVWKKPTWIDTSPPNWDDLSVQRKPLWVGHVSNYDNSETEPNEYDGLYLGSSRFGFYSNKQSQWTMIFGYRNESTSDPDKMYFPYVIMNNLHHVWDPDIPQPKFQYSTSSDKNPTLLLQGSLFVKDCYIQDTLVVGDPQQSNAIQIGDNVAAAGGPCITRLKSDGGLFTGSWILGTDRVLLILIHFMVMDLKHIYLLISI
jgi:hypothetical protein